MLRDRRLVISFCVALMIPIQFVFGQQKQFSLLDSLKALPEKSDSLPEQIETWYKASESLQRSRPEVVQQISKWMIDASQPSSYLVGLGMGYEQLGNSYYYLRKADSSVWAYKESLSYYRKAETPKKVFTLYNYLVMAYRLAGNNDSTQLYVKKELEQAAITNDSSNWAMALHDEGFHLSENNQLDKAITAFFKAQKYVKKNDYQTGININNGIGDCYQILGNNAEAIKYFYASRDIALGMVGPKPRQEFCLAQSYNRIASAFLETKDIAHARIAVKEQLSHALLAEDREQVYRAHLNYGILYSNTRQYDSAVFEYLQAMKIQKAVGRKRAIGIIHYNMAGVYNAWGKFSKALLHADSAQKIFVAGNYKSWEIENYYTLGQAYEGLGRFKEAFQNMRDYADKNFETMGEDNNQKIAEMQAAYEVEKKDAAIAVLNKENELKDSQRNFLMVIVASLLATAILIFYLYRQKQKSNNLLSEKNLIIERSLQERETLLKEIHHRVKNNLQIISSLLSLQSKSLGDSAAQGAISESRNRVKSMSLIHEQLYQEDTISGVEMKDYINRLVSSLTSSYGLDADRVEIKIEAENILLDVDSAIPLGLIINELVSNSMKYAFPDQRNGAILISLKDTMDELLLMVKDDGVGMDASIKSGQSFGLSMVNSLMRKLKAEMNIVSQAGTSVQISIKDFKKITLA